MPRIATGVRAGNGDAGRTITVNDWDAVVVVAAAATPAHVVWSLACMTMDHVVHERLVRMRVSLLVYLISQFAHSFLYFFSTWTSLFAR